MAGGGGAAAGGAAAVGGHVGEEDSAGRGLGAEGGAAGKTMEASCGAIEAGGEAVGAGSAGDAAEEVDGAAGGGVDCTGVPSAVLRVRSLGSVARDGVEVEGWWLGVEEGGSRLEGRGSRRCEGRRSESGFGGLGEFLNQPPNDIQKACRLFRCKESSFMNNSVPQTPYVVKSPLIFFGEYPVFCEVSNSVPGIA